MARPKPDLPSADRLRALVDSEGRLAVRVTPGARQECITITSGEVAIHVRARPQDGAANDAVCKLLARALGLAPSRVTLLRGATSRHKQVQIDFT